MTTLQLAKADRSLGVEMKPSPFGEKRPEHDSPEPSLYTTELRHVPYASAARSEASLPVYYIFSLQMFSDVTFHLKTFFHKHDIYNLIYMIIHM